jgi:hypothetical protein
MRTGRRHPWLGVLVVIAACWLWTVPGRYIQLPILRALYQFGELVGITPTAASGAGTLGGQVWGFNYSRPPHWYGFTAQALAAGFAFMPVLLPALWIRRRLASGALFVATTYRVRLLRAAACIAAFGAVSTTLRLAWYDDLFMALVRLFERLGASAVWIGVLVVTADGPFVGGTGMDTVGNYVVNYGPSVLLTAIAAAAAVGLHALLWYGDLRRAADSRLCGACGYDLRGTPSGSPCPECGRMAHAIHGRLSS